MENILFSLTSDYFEISFTLLTTFTQVSTITVQNLSTNKSYANSTKYSTTHISLLLAVMIYADTCTVECHHIEQSSYQKL